MQYEKLVELINKFKAIGKSSEDIREIIKNVIETTEGTDLEHTSVYVPKFDTEGTTVTGEEQTLLPKVLNDLLGAKLTEEQKAERKAQAEASDKTKEAEHKMRTDALPEHQKEYAEAQDRVVTAPEVREQDLHKTLFDGLTPEEIKSDFVKHAQDAVTMLGNAYLNDEGGHKKVADMLHKMRAAKREGKKFYDSIDKESIADIAKHLPGKDVKTILNSLSKYYDGISTHSEDIDEAKVNEAERHETGALRTLKSQVKGLAKALTDEEYANEANKSVSAKRTHYKDTLSPLDPLFSGGTQKDAKIKTTAQNPNAWDSPELRSILQQEIDDKAKPQLSKDEWLTMFKSDPNTRLHIKANQHDVNTSQMQLTVFNKDNPNGEPYELFGKDIQDFIDAWRESGLKMPDIDFVVNERKATDATADSSKSDKMAERYKQMLTQGDMRYVFSDPSQDSVVTRDENGFVTEYAKDKTKPTPASIKYDDSYIKHLAAMINNGDIDPDNITEYITNGAPSNVPESYIDKSKREIRVNIPGGESYSVPAPDDDKLKEQLEQLKVKTPRGTKFTIEGPRIPNKAYNPMSATYNQFKDDSQRNKALALVKDIIGLNKAFGNDYTKGQNFWGKGGLDAGSLRSLSNKFAKLRSLPGYEGKSVEDLIKDMPIWIPNDKSLLGGSMFDLADFIGDIDVHPGYDGMGHTDKDTKEFTPFTLNDLYSAQFKLNQYKRNRKAPIDRQELRDFLDSQINKLKLAKTNKDYSEVSSKPDEFTDDMADEVLKTLDLGRAYLDTPAERKIKIQQMLDPRELADLTSLADAYPEEYEAVKKRYLNDKIELNTAIKDKASFDDINMLRKQMLKSRNAMEAFDQKVKVNKDADGNVTVEDMSPEELQEYLHPDWDKDDLYTTIDKDLLNRELAQRLKDDAGVNNVNNPNVMFNALSNILDKLSETSDDYKGWANKIRDYNAPLSPEKSAEDFEFATETLGWTPSQYNAWMANREAWNTDKATKARHKVNARTAAPRLVGVDDISITDTSNEAAKAIQDLEYREDLTDEDRKQIIDNIKKDKGIHSKLDEVKDQLNNLIEGIMLDRPEVN